MQDKENIIRQAESAAREAWQACETPKPRRASSRKACTHCLTCGHCAPCQARRKRLFDPLLEIYPMPQWELGRTVLLGHFSHRGTGRIIRVWTIIFLRNSDGEMAAESVVEEVRKDHLK